MIVPRPKPEPRRLTGSGVEESARDTNPCAAQLLEHLHGARRNVVQQVVERPVGEVVLHTELLDAQALLLGSSPDVLRNGSSHPCAEGYSETSEDCKCPLRTRCRQQQFRAVSGQ